MTTIVTLQVRNVDPRDPVTAGRLHELEDYAFSHINGATRMKIFVDEQQPVVTVVLEAARKLTEVIPGAEPVRVHPDLVTTSDIANRVGVSREAVRKWTLSQRKPFPAQFDTLGADQRVWRWVEVCAWLWGAKAIDMAEDLPRLHDIDEIDWQLSRMKPDHQKWSFATTQAKFHFKSHSVSTAPRKLRVYQPARPGDITHAS